jgi:hypothetical protein
MPEVVVVDACMGRHAVNNYMVSEKMNTDCERRLQCQTKILAMLIPCLSLCPGTRPAQNGRHGWMILWKKTIEDRHNESTTKDD